MKLAKCLELLRNAEDMIFDAKSLTVDNKPHVVCGNCGGKGKVLDADKAAQVCIDCNGCGWLPKWRFEELYDVG